MSAQPNLAIVSESNVEGFDYGALEPALASKARAVAARIHARMKRTVQDVVEFGQDLEMMRNELPRGRFVPWLRAEFGQSRRWAEHQIHVAAWLTAKCEIISHLQLRIDPTAAYLLAAPSTPEEAREEALNRAMNGERITVPIARAILDEILNAEEDEGTLPAYRLRPRLGEILARYRQRWEERSLKELIEQLREFAEFVEQSQKKKDQKG
jgi:hypothetical protein